MTFKKFAFSSLFIFTVLLNVLSQTYKLPDGSNFPYWSDVTVYTNTYFVNQNHPEASDDNPGTFNLPFKTINKAAQTVKAGEKVTIYSGVYQEKVQPENSGESPEKMILYEAAPGAVVKIKGSVRFNEEWTASTAVLGFQFARDIWQAPLDKEKFSPFYIENANEAEMKLMPWAEKWTNKIPYTLKRGMAFQDGKRMIQLSTYEDLLKVPGAFWVDEENEMIHIHPFDNINPNNHRFELTNRQQLFVPAHTNINYLRIKGLIFEHAGNGFPRVGTGAVFVNGGHHWIFEENTIRQVNSVGIEAGARVKEKSVSTEEENKAAEDHPGGFIIQNNHIYECGTGGIQGHTVRNTLHEKNYIHHIGWQSAEQYWESAAIKILVNKNTVVAHNTLHDINEASGIWLDWNNQNSRVTGNLLYDIGRTSNGAVFIEASIVPNMVDNNIIWSVEGPGISLYDTDDAIVCYNLIAYAEPPLSSRVNTNRSLNGEPLTSKNNVISNNLFYKNKTLPVIDDPENTSNHNVFVDNNLEKWQQQGFDKNSESVNLRMDWNPNTEILEIFTEKSLPRFEASEQCKTDYWGKPRFKQISIPAPWQVITTGTTWINLTQE